MELVLSEQDQKLYAQYSYDGINTWKITKYSSKIDNEIKDYPKILAECRKPGSRWIGIWTRYPSFILVGNGILDLITIINNKSRIHAIKEEKIIENMKVLEKNLLSDLVTYDDVYDFLGYE